MGPFYCPGDQKVYLDLSFYEDIRTKLESASDAAFAYVIAHEVGHHVQNLLGILPKVHKMQQQVGKRGQCPFRQTRIAGRLFRRYLGTLRRQ